MHCVLQETGTVKEENDALRGQLADIEASLTHLTAANHASLQDAEVSDPCCDLPVSSRQSGIVQ